MFKQGTRALVSSVRLLFGPDTRIKTQRPRPGAEQNYCPPAVSKVDAQKGARILHYGFAGADTR